MSTKGRFGKPALEWEPLPYMDQFLDELTGELRSPDYIRKVKLGLAHFALFCHDENILHPEEVTRTTLLRFQAMINGKEWTPTYRQQLLKYVRAWINWMVDVHYLPESPWYRIRVGQTQKIPKPLDDEEVAMLFQAHRQQAFSLPPFPFHRQEVILTLLYAWGLRINELNKLNVAGMDVHLDYVQCYNKGGRIKQMPYTDILKQTVQRWLRQRSAHGRPGEDALLIDSRGNRFSHDMIYNTIKTLGDRANVTVNPHRLRDTCGTHLLDSDVEVERVMAILGHTRMAQTLAYSRVNDHKVHEAHSRAFNPRLEKLLIANTRDLTPADDKE